MFRAVDTQDHASKRSKYQKFCLALRTIALPIGRWVRNAQITI